MSEQKTIEINPNYRANWAPFKKKGLTASYITPILDDKELSFRARIMLLHIYSLSVKKGYCFALNHFFAKKLGTSISTVQRIIRELEKNEIIEVKLMDSNNGTDREIHINLRLFRRRYLQENVNVERKRMTTAQFKRKAEYLDEQKSLKKKRKNF